MARQKKDSVQDDIRNSAHRIWLAGLGALSAAEEEGSKLFGMLVERGERYEAKGKSKAREARSKAGSAWEKLEAGFDDKIAAALKRVGVPTRKEVADLIDRVERLTRAVEGKAAAGKAKKKKKAAGKTAKKKTVGR